jgi:hypothetical protein
MVGGLSRFVDNAITKYVFEGAAAPSTTCYVMLCTNATTPTETTNGTEVATANTNYARQAYNFTGVNWEVVTKSGTPGIVLRNLTAITFPAPDTSGSGVDWGALKWASLIDNNVGGNYLGTAQLRTVRYVKGGTGGDAASITIPARSLEFRSRYSPVLTSGTSVPGGGFSIAGATPFWTRLWQHVFTGTADPRPANYYMALWTDATTPSDSLNGLEQSGGAYARQQFPRGTATPGFTVTNGSVANKGAATFPVATVDYTNRLRYLAWYDALAGGNCVGWAEADDRQSIQVLAGNQVVIPDAAFTINRTFTTG